MYKRQAFNSLNEGDVKNLCEIDLQDVGCEMFSGDEIVTYASTESTEANGEEDDQPIKPTISHEEAIQSLTTAIKWYECQDEAEVSKIISLSQIHNLAL